MDKIYVDNQTVEKAILKVAKKLEKKLKRLGIPKNKVSIIGVARGGLMPAQYLAYLLDINRVETVQVSAYMMDENGALYDEIDIYGAASIDFQSDHTVIVVDDIYDTGTTIETLKQLLENLSAEHGVFNFNIIPAVIFAKGKKKDLKEVDLIWGARIKNKDSWLVFPWDKLVSTYKKINEGADDD